MLTIPRRQFLIGSVKVPLRDLDDVLVRAKRWGLRLDTPWRDADGLTEPV
jgi:hypothetical protein